MDERDYKAMNEELKQESCLGAVISSAYDRAKELLELVEDEVIIEKNLKLFKKLRDENK